jgi:tetratricopeptide (TPR) repeat protein
MTRRRAVVGGGVLVLGAAGGIVLWRGSASENVSPEARLLIQKGLDALQNNDALDTQDPGSTLQAIALLTDATEAAPRSATAWGGLAMAYAVRKRNAPLAERPGLDARSRSAAKTALALDPNESRALGSLRLLDSVYRSWSAAERADRHALAKNPRLPILLFIMSDVLGSVGRWREAVQFSSKFDRRNFLIPGADRKVIIDLWSAGDLPAADKALETAVQHWPQHPQIWRTRLAYLMYSGRPTETLDLVRRSGDHPLELSADFLDTIRVTAEALAGQRNAGEAVGKNLEYLKAHPSFALQVAQACVALGAFDQAFELLHGYYFSEGRWLSVAPPGGDQDRTTSRLFQPPMRGIWADRRFEQLLQRIGLTEYWRRSGTVPDFRDES